MSKKAFFKKLLVAGLCAVTATATVGFVACKKDKDEDNKKNEQVQEHNVTWDLDGGSWQTGKEGKSKVEDGAKLTKPDNPTKSGKEFDKWVLKADGTTAYDFDSAVKGDVALKAIWKDPTPSGGGSTTPPGGGSTTPTDNEWTITWNLDGGTWPNDYTAPTKVTKGQKVTAPTTAQQPSQSGKTFAGWVDANGDAFDFDTAPTANTTIKATWDNATYTITYDMNGHGDPLPPETDATNYDNLQGTTATGWKFMGWYLEAACTNKATGTISQSGTVYAKWKEIITYDVIAGRTNKIEALTSDFSTQPDGTKLEEFTGTYGLQGFYSSPDSAGNYSTDYAWIKDGQIQQVSGSKKNIATIIDFGPVKNVVEGYLEINCTEMGSKWEFVQFYAGNNKVFTIKTDADKNLAYSLNGVDGTSETSLAPAKDTVYKISYKFDLTTGKVSADIAAGTGEFKPVVTELDAHITEISGIQLITSNNAGRLIKLDNVAVAADQMSVAEYKTYVNAKFDKLAQNDAYTGAQLVALESARDAAKDAVDVESDIAGVYNAYCNGVTAMKAVKSDLDVYKETKCTELDTYRATKTDTDYSSNGVTKLAEAVTKGKENINKATSQADVDTALTEAKAAVDAVPDLAVEAELAARDDISITVVKPDTANAKSYIPNSGTDTFSDGAATLGTGNFINMTYTSGSKNQPKIHNDGYFTTNKNGAVVWTFTTTSDKATIYFEYNGGGSNGRIFTLYCNDVKFGEGSPKTSSHEQKTGEYEAAAYGSNETKGKFSIILGEAGVYTIKFDTNEHKIDKFTLTENAPQSVSAKVDSLTATVAETASVGATIADLVSNVAVKAEYEDEKYDQTITDYTIVVKNNGGQVVTSLDATGEYTLIVINGTSKTEADATEYNSESYTVHVS